MDLSIVSSYIMQYAINPLMWLIILIIFLLGVFAILWIRRRKRLVYPVAEVVDLGKGKGCINTDLRAGWFGKKLMFKGLLWSGEEVMRTNRGDIIEDFSTEDFQEVNGERGIICYRDPIRQNILVPINRVDYKNKELVASIAPSDYTDTATDIVKDAIAETKDWKDKLIEIAVWALMVIGALVIILVIVQYVKSAQDKAAELLLNAGTEGAKACKDICSQAVSQALSIKNGVAP